jgi:bifunctional UDP-N-acetylglucosamine pyrophosphorylase / glucosamine-1-phosphate N-acetyltransferase
MAYGASLHAIILAAGRSTRFNTDQTKLSFKLCGQEMILYPVKLLSELKIPVTLVVGYQKELVQDIIAQEKIDVTYIEQKEQRGTGHAVLCSKPLWSAEHILIMNGDMPLVSQSVIKDLITHHIQTEAAITFATAHNSDPELVGYGRVIRDSSAISIVEHRDFRGDPSEHCCINAGIYLIKKTVLEAFLEQLPPSPSGEIYLTDLIHTASMRNLRIETVTIPFDCVRGVNTLRELWIAEHLKRSEFITLFMEQGVRFYSPSTVHIDVDVTIGSGTTIGLGAVLLKGTRIGKQCSIGHFSIINNSTLGNTITVLPHSVIYDSTIHDYAQVGPFAHIHRGSTIGNHTVIGNFVETSLTHVGSYTKAKHLTYLGNAEIGSRVNIGAGTVTCNYDGFTKHTTTIHDNAFIGSDSILIAPVSIGKEAITGAGSTITDPVPDNALAVARARQITKDYYADKVRQRKKAQTPSVTSTSELA